MDQRFEQLQKDMQDQLQEQLAKMQDDMREQMLEAQRNMMAEMTQLLRATDKGKAPMTITGEEGEDYPPGFTPPHVPTQTDALPMRPSVTIRPQQGSVDTGIPMNFLTGSGFNLGDNPANPVIPDLDTAKKEDLRTEAVRQLEDRCKWLEEKFKALESAEGHQGVDAKDLSLVPDHKFKTSEFEKYNGTTCPEAHITMFCRRMTSYVNNDQLLIHCFQDSLIGAAARITLQNVEKKPNESFRQYAQIWREIAMQVQPPFLEKETTMLFINTLKASFITHMIGKTTKSFVDIVMAGEMIENTIRGGKIEGETTKRSTPRRNKVNNASNYNSKSAMVSQPRAVTVGQRGLQMNEFGARQNSEKIQFTPIPVTYNELYQNLFDAYWDNRTFHRNCTTFKKLVEKFTKIGVIKFDDKPGTENPLPNYSDQGVNVIGEDEAELGNLEGIRPYKLESSLNN
ncbi:uncharacterized protein LOC108458630 [Gossypium arboreum]|uniref:uncharacterized protein LOC108458630 n=1 Tax=Gossypium arboreum TaxID=29729 RepID=UPI000818FA26|nr:uncharacterized protein LOC108458630 [Gossypium arboreum]